MKKHFFVEIFCFFILFGLSWTERKSCDNFEAFGLQNCQAENSGTDSIDPFLFFNSNYQNPSRTNQYENWSIAGNQVKAETFRLLKLKLGMDSDTDFVLITAPLKSEDSLFRKINLRIMSNEFCVWPFTDLKEADKDKEDIIKNEFGHKTFGVIPDFVRYSLVAKNLGPFDEDFLKSGDKKVFIDVYEQTYVNENYKESNLYKTVEKLKDAELGKLITARNRFRCMYRMEGYGDFAFNYRFDKLQFPVSAFRQDLNSHLTNKCLSIKYEVQIHLASMLIIKSAGHSFFEIKRILDSFVEATKTMETVPQDQEKTGSIINACIQKRNLDKVPLYQIKEAAKSIINKAGETTQDIINKLIVKIVGEENSIQPFVESVTSCQSICEKWLEILKKSLTTEELQSGSKLFTELTSLKDQLTILSSGQPSQLVDSFIKIHKILQSVMTPLYDFALENSNDEAFNEKSMALVRQNNKNDNFDSHKFGEASMKFIIEEILPKVTGIKRNNRRLLF